MVDEEQEAFSDVLREATGGSSQTEIADRTGVSQSYVHALLHRKRAPSREIVQQLADGLGLGGEPRRRLFRSAGYVVDTGESPTSGLSVPVVEVARKMEERGLTVQQLDTVRRLVEDPHRIDAIRLLLNPGVIFGNVESVRHLSAF
jgi:transcriptional regulator with XRE-family HTH domain